MSDFSVDRSKGNNPVYAFKCFLKGLSFLRKPELRSFLVIPVIINVILYVTALILGVFYISNLVDRLIPEWLDWLSWIIWPLLLISFFMAGFFTFTLLANLLAAPFYGKLSAKTKMLLTGQSIDQGFEQPYSKNIMSELKRWGYLLTRIIPILLIFMIPVVNLIASVVWVLFGAWCIVLEYMAYPLENEGLLFPEQRSLIKSIRVGSLSFGGIVIVVLTLPVINILVPPAAVIGATIYLQGIKNNNE